MGNISSRTIGYGVVLPPTIKQASKMLTRYDELSGKPYQKILEEVVVTYPTWAMEGHKKQENCPEGEEDDWSWQNNIPSTDEDATALIWYVEISFRKGMFVGALLHRISHYDHESYNKLEMPSQDQINQIVFELSKHNIPIDQIGLYDFDTSEW